MANINWDSQELESTAAQVNTLLQNYDKTMDEIQQTLNTMEFRLKLRTDVDNDLSKLKRRVSQECSKMQQVRQTVNLAASKTTDLNGKLIGYTNDIGDLSIKSNTTNISAGNSVNFLQWTALGSLGISGMVDVISGFVSKIGSWFSGKKKNTTETIQTSNTDYSGSEQPNTIPATSADVIGNAASANSESAYYIDKLRTLGVSDDEIAKTISEGGSLKQMYDAYPISLNHDVTRDRTYGNAELWLVDGYRWKDQRDIWPSNYSGGGSCAVCSLSMSLSTLGIKALPKDIMKYNKNNSVYMEANAWKGTNYRSDLVDVGSSYGTNGLDSAIEKYIKYPGEYSAPVIKMDYGNGTHYVTVVGKNNDGSYIIADGSGNNMTTFRVTGKSNGYYRDSSKKACAGAITAIHQYKVNS